MPEVYRESRTTYARDSSPSDDEYKRTTVRRYKVTPDRAVVERVERDVDVIDVDRRSSRYAGRSDLLEAEPRIYNAPERPRSAFEPPVRDRDERYSRVDRVEYRGDDGHRGAMIERERVVERDDDFYSDRDRDRGGGRSRVVYESSKEVERNDAYSPRSPRDWERRAYWDDKDTEVRIEKRVEHRDDGAEVRIERRVEERRDDSVERWRKETEYFEPAPAPIVIRQRAPEQRIIVQEAPAPAPLVIREQQESREVVASRHPSHHDDEYYYRREMREVGPYVHREEEVAIEHYDDHRHRHHHSRHHHHHSHSHSHHRHHSDGESGDEYYKKTVIRRDRSSSGSPHRKRHIAEGALAGAGLSAILATRRNGHGELPENRGRKVLAGAALGAIGTEVVRRAHSAYEDKYGDDERDREYERGGEKPHSRIKTGLGIAAVALAAAGAAKYYQSNKIEKEELSRGRSRRRYTDDESSRSPSRKRSKSRASSLAKAAAGTAAVAGLVKHYRDKRSKSRDGKSRSRSRLRTGAEIVAAGLAGAGAKKLYDKRKDKKEKEKERSRSLSEHSRGYSSVDDYERDDRDRRRRSRSRSVTRSGPTYPDADSSTADPELGMVEYGTRPLHVDPRYPEYGAGAAGYESAAEESRNHRRKKRRSRSRGDSDYSGDSDTESRKPERKRSRSRLRDVATGVAAAGAAAIGIKKYKESKEKEKEKEKEQEREKEKDEKERRKDRRKDRDSDRDFDSDRSSRDRRARDKERRRYEDESSTLDGYPDGYGQRPPSPPHASGGYYNPPPPSGPYHHPNVATTNLADPNFTPHYPGYQPPPQAPNPGGMHPPPIHPNDPEHVSEDSVGRSTQETEATGRPAEIYSKKDGISRSVSLPPLAIVPIKHEDSDTPQTAKSVAFIPMSPRSSAALRRHREELAAKAGKDGDDKGSDAELSDADYFSNLIGQLIPHRRRDSDPSSDRPLVSRRRPKSNDSQDSGTDEEVIEVLPDRFDSQGRPINGSGTGTTARVHSRRGDFEYRNPKGPRGTNVHGEWSVAGTDPEAVERIVRNVTGVLEGRGSWLGLLGEILGGGLLQGVGGREGIEDGEDSKRRDRRNPRRRRSTGGHDHDRDDVDNDYFYDDERKRRHMVREGKRREWDEG